ncbi:MAG TPA: tetratricopeptide repeat-containing serine protease family protein, partial [Pirellulaceae bacterium]
MQTKTAGFGQSFVGYALLVAALGGLIPSLALGQKTDTKQPRTSVRRLPVPEIEPATEDSPHSLAPRQLYDQVLKSVVMIINGDTTGTGWVVDMDRRLIVTNQHVVSTSEKVEVMFPTFEQGRLQVDLDFYRELTPAKGVVVDSVGDFDLALIQMDELPKRTQALELAAESAAPGERVHAIGGLPQGSQGLWKYSTGVVSLVSSGKGVGLAGRVMQSNIDINPGNSGGPIVNDFGQVVGVSKSINTDARDVSYNVDVEAVREYVKLVLPLLDDPNPSQTVTLGKRHLDAGRTQVAMRQFTDAIKRDPKLAEAHAQRGWAFIAQSDYVTAISDFGTALELDHNNATAWYGRGRARRLMGENEEAVKDLSSGIANDPENGIVYNERALVQESMKKYDLAMRDYDRGVELSPDNAQIIANRADLMVTLERYDDALPEIRRAIGLQSDNAWFHNVLGLAHYRKREYPPAVDAFQRAAELNPDSATYIANLADAWQMQGEHKRSIESWNRAIELDSTNAYY